MDEDMRDIDSAELESVKVETLLGRIESIADKAADIRDRREVENPELYRALKVVEDFLRRRGRICYGGMAINAHLPQKKKFYDFTKVLPDYDFYSPSPNKDVKELLDEFKAQGFTTAVARLAMHKGTTKVSVDYHPVADISYMPVWLYDRLKQTEIVDKGISYTDADFLRMRMYLELSRPQGEVERWDKVYKRLLLLNRAAPINMKDCVKKSATKLSAHIHSVLMDYVLEKNLIFMGSEIEKLYQNPNVKRSAFIKNSDSPIITLSNDPRYHMKYVKDMLQKLYTTIPIKSFHLHLEGEHIPEVTGVVVKNKVVFLCINEEVCLSYNTILYSTKGGRHNLRIASLDTAIYTYYLLGYIHGLKGILPWTSTCFAKQLVKISGETRDKGHTGKYPFLAITCEGPQPTVASLLRQKVNRVRAFRAAEKRRHVKTQKGQKGQKRNVTGRFTRRLR